MSLFRVRTTSTKGMEFSKDLPADTHAPVVQWIGQLSPKEQVPVRLRARALTWKGWALVSPLPC